MTTYLSPESVVRGFFEALARHDFARAAGAIAEHCEWESVPTGTIYRGPSPIIAGLRDFVTGFPDWQVTIDRLTLAADIVVVEWNTTGTFTQPFRGETPNGRAFRRRGCAIADVQGGKIVRYRDFYDRVAMLEQVGLGHLLGSPAGSR